MKIPLLLAVILLSLLIESFFSGSEIALVSCNRIRIRVLADGGIRGARLILKLLKRPERLLATTLIGTNIAVIVSSFAANELFSTMFGRKYSGLAILLLVPLVLIFGETIPKSISRNNAEAIALFSIYPLSWIMLALFPLISISSAFATMILGKEKAKKRMKNPFVTKEELQIILTSEKSLQERYETALLKKILDFATASVRNHMTPLSKIISISKDFKIVDAIKTITESGFTRIPVFDGEKENIIGIIDARDLLETGKPDELIEAKIRKVLTVRENEKIQNLLREFQTEGYHLALVQNAEKKAIGIITVEDILEEIVGDIIDEFDKPPKDGSHHKHLQ